MTKRDIRPATGKLGVLTPGLGAVASTFIAGTAADTQALADHLRGHMEACARPVAVSA